MCALPCARCDRAPGFTITAVLTLALGIGANAVIYTLSIQFCCGRCPMHTRIGWCASWERIRRRFPRAGFANWARIRRAFKSVAGYGPDAESNISESDVPDRVFGATVTVNALDTLGIHPALGSFFSADDAIEGQDHDVVLSYGYWRQHFGGEPSALGAQMRIDGVSRRIIGVMPAGVRFPYADTQFVIPVSFRGDDAYDPWSEIRPAAHSVGWPTASLRRRRRLSCAGCIRVLLPLFPWQDARHLGI